MKLRFWCREKSRYETQCDYMLEIFTTAPTHPEILDREVLGEKDGLSVLQSCFLQ